MEQFVTTLMGEVDRDLRKIESRDTETLERSRDSVECLAEAMERLKNFTTEYTFSDEPEEVRFFRHLKPGLLSRFIYYRRVYEIELSRPIAGKEVQTAYLQREAQRIMAFFERNMEFFHYFRSGSTHLDRYYFMRGNDGRRIGEGYYYERDTQFSTFYDYKVAKILANDLVQAYLREELHQAEHHADPFAGFPKERHLWTDSKIHLVELIYALKAAASINYGKLHILEMKRYAEMMYNVDLGKNVPRSFYDLRIRQNPTEFLDILKEALLKLLEEKNG